MEDCLLSAAELGPSPNPDPPSISGESWTLAEETTVEVLNCIHPTLDSEEKRKDVIDYLQRLIRNSIGCEVFAYGSVPLKTYLPDGDIDLTGFRSNSLEENLARDVLGILLREEQNQNAEFQVKDTQFIDAEVKLVKCLIQNMVIDISFNQLGGICTLCFLEQVDRLIGKDHLLKRSIILIKAWCYYESRILGANHGLISTYALETLVLYIFHLFSSSLNGPLAVLYRFLDYFSKFDWENYCISLHGPVRKASLPDLVVEAPENGGDFIFGKENLRNCVEIFSLPSLDTSSTPFPLKHLNIIDPLRENNNLGRSVHKGNYYRICSAFKYGARKLGQILRLPKEELGDEIKSFFSNTLDRHGPKVDNFVLPSALEFSRTFSMSSRGEKLSDYLRLKSLNLEIDDDNPDLSDESCVLRHRLDEDANDLSTSRGRSGNETLDCSSISELGNSGENFCSSFKYLDFREMGLLVISGNDENLNPLSDLCGDYHGHLRSLLYGKSCHGFPFSAPMLRSMPLPLPPLNRNLCSQMKMNGVPLPFCPVFGLKEHLKTRGTGTYFPKTNWCSCIEKSPKWRGRNSANQSKLQGTFRKNGITHAALPAKSSLGEGTLKPIKGHEKSVLPMKSHQSNSVGTHVNGFSNSSLRIEFGSFGKR